MNQLLDILRNMDVHIAAFAAEHTVGVYALLFAIIFAETGLVILPFLPGDSLLFTIGALSVATEKRGAVFDPWIISLVLFVAGVLGDAVNYHVGKALGPRIFRGEAGTGWYSRLLNRKHLDRAHTFYEKHGGKAIVLGRFVPIVRTFVPFVAGAGLMNYRTFFVYNVIGAALWIGVCVGAGVVFGNIPWVKNNFEAVVIGIIVVSLIPVFVEFLLAKRRQATATVAK
ncbi:MAG: VTT domain-containing protein [Phycisphaerales bacterium]|jgi:membrane-associated protein